ncbi:MAG: right-handed parallel beta-helix repeat-containing protein [Akkermansiaceae bacterium]|jgi:parallel beta-helix repeat protein|nr:right-handed parallel beta-helix repeat-containing protein [Akkermansiaceae bacterium]MDP4721017.1 right-handed parallel beta-helix repeat-containing protein [Akkermansiaceae bacterium]MDP4781634.1 right-handed parallel beta-helix repeat-containing protein [Akkermansiaceae bacterium]MDP4847930.1 right-handed parallel beta-helix repeat-containing protein [Akkermansiaceae bacterium]MDP4897671.1 right-handed parallel beta-helix repeat-containing protein [Akkermansiaceae bacterium]
MSPLRPLACMALSVSFLTAGELYISPAGNDANPGTLAAPWKTFSKAAASISAGDTLFMRSGTYAERLILSGKSGTAEAPIVICAYAEETAVIDGDTLTVPGGGRQGLVVLENCSHIRLEGLEIRNFTTEDKSRIPVGIQIEGSGSGITVKGCKVHRIWQNSTNGNANGFGVSVYGTSTTAIDLLVLEENEVCDLRTGQSESVVINGNVTNFTVAKNHVHHCNNIGIDFIGYEGSAPGEVDRARNGVCRENLVHDIDSRFNPGYGGDFTKGGGDGSAAGIYVDGGTEILISRNRVHGCNFGIELASEHANGFTENITMTDNLLHHNLGPGIIMGGYDAKRGKTRNCTVSHNTLFRNDTLHSYGGQIALQFYLEGNAFTNNIIWADAKTKQMIVHYVEGGKTAQRAFPAGNVFASNLYFCEDGEDDIEFGLNPDGTGKDKGNRSYNGLAAWRKAVGGEVESVFADPGLRVPVPEKDSPDEDFRRRPGSEGDFGWRFPS